MLTLYYGPGTCSLVAHIGLRMADASFELQRVNLQAGEQNEAAFREISPHGRVPILVLDDGAVITESAVIATYIAEAFPTTNLLPTDPMQLVRAREMITWANGTLHGTTFAAIFRPARFSDDPAVQKDLTANGKTRLVDQLGFADQRAGSRDWAPAGHVTITDLFLYVYGRWAGRVGVDLSAFPHLSSLMAMVDALPETQAALEAEGLK